MQLKFSKMHGLGNDFMVVDCITQNCFFAPEYIKRLANRNTGVGFDQILLVEPPYNPDMDFHYRIFNADGSEAGQCGNGARCFAKFVRQKGLTNKSKIKVTTQSGKISLNITHDDLVTVDMGEPVFEPEKIPFIAKSQEKTYLLRLEHETLFCGVVNVGNPHCVTVVKDVLQTDVDLYGALIEVHARFPKKVNVEFMQVISRDEIKLRVFERGVGETLACGSGACAAVAIGILQGLLNKKVKVNLPGGFLYINWDGVDTPLYMTGPAEHVYDGIIKL